MKVRQSAEEICQDVFLKVYRKSKSFDTNKKFKPWLWTIARNTTLDHLRKKSELLYEDFTTKDDDSNFEIADTSDGAEDILIKKMETKRFGLILDKLPVNQKEALLYQVFSDLNYEEVSDITGKSISSVKSLLFRARKSLTELLEKNDEK